MPRSISIYNPYEYPLVFLGTDDTELTLHPRIWTRNIDPKGQAVKTALKDKKLLVNYKGQTSRHFQLPRMLLCGPIDPITGYGILTEKFIHNLAQKMPVSLFELSHWHKYDGMSPIVSQLMDDAYKRIVPHEWALCFSIPPELPRVPAVRRILFSMWETDRLPGTELPKDNPDRWEKYVNEWADALIVPCQNEKEVWLRCGVKVPIYVCPLGVDTDIYKYKERPPRSEYDKFTILTYGMLTSRKSPIETITDVCWRALGKEQDWKLIVKTRAGQTGGGEFSAQFADDRIETINQDYMPEQMADLCYQSDVGIFLSRYEGWGLPPREMMATGLPVIWTNHSGHKEDCNPNYNIPIGTLGQEDGTGPYSGMGGWYKPDYEEAARALRAEYLDWKARGRTQSLKGMWAANYINHFRTWRYCSETLLGILREITGYNYE